MIKYTTLIFLFFTQFIIAQIPSNYYDSANGLSGYTLKSKLKTIITNGHVNRGYDGLYIGYVTTDTDRYYENDGTVLDIYSEKPNGADSYNYNHASGDQCGTYNSEADCYNREHVVPQSVFNEAAPMVSDIHSVIPTDGYVNNRRSNYPFGKINNATWTSTNGSKVGSNVYPGYSGTVFEPIDEFKGDVARMLFYFATRYETQIDSWTFPMFNHTKDKVFTDWALNMLIEWHTNDPVSQREIDRNNAAYNFQGNANPFISHPEWVRTIWSPAVDIEKPSTPTNLVVLNATPNSLTLSWEASTDNVGVVGYNLFKDNVFLTTVSSNSYIVTGLNPLTSYSFYVIAKDVANNLSNQSNTVVGTTTENSGTVSGTSTELFISEYVEGSSNNKALEISNFTSSSKDLSIYSIKRNVNGAGGWGVPLTLTGTLTVGGVYVIAHSSFTTIPVTPNISTSADAILFNGNDPIGLFKDDVLIDIVGVLNGGAADFAKDVTLRRKSTIVNPNTTFNLLVEWDSYPMDTFVGLGNHSLSIANSFENGFFSIYPNPASDYIFIDQTLLSSDLKYEIYNTLGQKMMGGTLNSDKIYIENLKEGIYFLNIFTKNTVKMIKIIIEK